MEGKIVFRKEVVEPIINELLKNGHYIVDESNENLSIVQAYLEDMEKNGNLVVDRKPNDSNTCCNKYDLTDLGKEFLSK